MKRIRLVFSMFAVTALLASCGGEGNSNVFGSGDPDKTVEVAGEAARDTARTAISSAIQNAANPTGSGGASVGAPSAVSPDPAVFSDDSGTAKLTTQQGVELSPWEGPLAGPDGVDGWYRRTYSWSWPGTDGTQVTQESSYWFRTVPEHDFKLGWAAMGAAEEVHYGWTNESGFWEKSRFLLSFTFKEPVNLPDGSIQAGRVAGKWSWEVDEDANHYAGSKSNGEYEFVTGLHEYLSLENEQARNTILELKPGKDLRFEGGGEYKSSYSGVYFDYNNSEVGRWFGGGLGTNIFSSVVTKESETSLVFHTSGSGDATWFWGAGDQDNTVNYFERPDYDGSVTPPGAIWGTLPGHDDNFGKLRPATFASEPGLLYWSTSEYWSTWGGTFGFDAATGVPTGDDHNDQDFESKYYNRTESLSASGGDPVEYVSCSSKEISSDCPDTTNDNQTKQ